VSKTIGRVRVAARSKFGWRVGTESEVVVAVGIEATTVVEATTVGVKSTVEATEVVGEGEWMSPMRVSNR